MTDPNPYIDPPDIPAHMTIPEFRASRPPRLGRWARIRRYMRTAVQR